MSIPPPTIQDTVGQISSRTSTITRCRVDKGWEIPYKGHTYRGGNFVPCGWEGTFVETQKSRRARGIKPRAKKGKKPAKRTKPQPRTRSKRKTAGMYLNDKYGYGGAYRSGTVTGFFQDAPLPLKVLIGAGLGFVASKIFR